MTLLLALIHAGLLFLLIANLRYLRRPGRSVPMASFPKISVLIPARNEEENLRRLLPSLLVQQYPSFEVIVYDDSSEDHTWDVLQSFSDERLHLLRGQGPPPGWIGKVHALYQATRHAGGDLYLFLDADARLEDEGALGRLAEQFVTLPAQSVMTGLTQLRGGGLLLVSLVPNAILCGLPWALVDRLRLPSLGALNGQCWMIPADVYHRHEPHRHLPREVLEDVQIGRYLTSKGLTPVLRNVQQEVSVFMYGSFREAWHGFRKNAYLIMGGRPVPFLLFFVVYLFTFVLAPFFSLWFLLSLYLIKRPTDRLSGFSPWLSLLAPVSYALGALLQLHSALSHWTGRVFWKGRRI